MVYAISDLHGRFDLFEKVQKHLDKDDTCVCLGDCVDRGPDGLKMIHEMRKDNRFILLKGNHEDIMQIVCSEYEDGGTQNLQYWFENGGEPTFEEYLQMPQLSRGSFLKYLRTLPLRMDYTNPDGIKLILTHAGFSPNVHDETEDIYLWCRSHINDPWTGKADEIIVHGHTYSKGRVHYCHGYKYNLDVASYDSGIVVLLNLDTLDYEVLSI